MDILFILNQQNIRLSLYELLLYLKITKYKLTGKFLIANKIKINMTKISRLAYTKKAYKIVSISEIETLKNNIDKLDWNKIIDGTYAIRNHNFKEFSEIELANMVYHKIKSSRVCLDSPNTKIEFYKINSNVYCCKLLYENNERYENRLSHKLPNISPTSMHPRLARAMVNIANEDEITDPFCGIGGILLEASLCKIKVVGYDIDKIQLDKAKENLDYYKIKNYKLIHADATKLRTKTKAIVTDPPYGKNSKTTEIPVNLYLKFLKNSEKITAKIVITFPNTIDYKKIIKKTHWHIVEEFDYYIHKSMTKKVLLLRNENYDNL
ncbi:MAG: methyltransferase domain-containing protein [Candidatus Woesearchaeota archaeon]